MRSAASIGGMRLSHHRDTLFASAGWRLLALVVWVVSSEVRGGAPGDGGDERSEKHDNTEPEDQIEGETTIGSTCEDQHAAGDGGDQ